MSGGSHMGSTIIYLHEPMKNLQAVREAIIAAVPDNFTQRSYTFHRGDFVGFEGKMVTMPPNFEFWLNKWIETGFVIGEITERFEDGQWLLILKEKVRLITLEDVLMAVEENELDLFDTTRRLLTKWALNSPLADQSQETIDFLHEILNAEV